MTNIKSKGHVTPGQQKDQTRLQLANCKMQQIHLKDKVKIVLFHAPRVIISFSFWRHSRQSKETV